LRPSHDLDPKSMKLESYNVSLEEFQHFTSIFESKKNTPNNLTEKDLVTNIA
jgi:hypothetical protein